METIPLLSRPWRSLAYAMAALLVLAACASGGTNDPDDDDSDPVTGSLAVTISGLPDGVAADVLLSGPDGSERIVTASSTLTDLAPGFYGSIAADVFDDGDTYGAEVTGSPAEVTAGGSASIAVTYALLEPVEIGTLVVDVTGLPVGADADVTVTGPDVVLELAAAQAIAGITPGTYVVSAGDVTYEGVSYQADVTGSPATVVADGSATATVAYSATSVDPGTLNVAISGLGAGVDADVTVTGPDGFEQAVTASISLNDLDPGTYTVTAEDVTDGDDVYAASISGSPATVPAGGSTAVDVAYTLLDPTTVGALEVQIEGLPEGVDADVEVAGVGIVETLTESVALLGLAPGNYTVVAEDVLVDGVTYGGLVSESPVLVLAEETPTVTVTYQPVAFADNDAASNPGLFAQFRKTSSAPVWIDRMLFNEDDPIDTKGIQLRNEVSDPGDPADFLAFRLVHGEAPTTKLTMSLECGFERDGPGSLLRVVLHDDEGTKIGGNLLCDGTRDYSVPNVGGSGDYLITIESGFSDPFYSDYVLSLNAYCFQACTYTEYEE